MTAHGPSGWIDERLQKETPAGEGDILHLVRRRDYPIALCGRVVHDEFNPHRTDTAGRDRCTDCLTVLRDLHRREA